MKNYNDTIGNRTRNIPACSAVPQPTAPPSAPVCTNSRCVLNRMWATELLLEPKFSDFKIFVYTDVQRNEVRLWQSVYRPGQSLKFPGG